MTSSLANTYQSFQIIVDEHATGLISGAALTASMGVASAGEVPDILGAADFREMVKAEMANITGENRGIKIRNVNNNLNINQQQQTQCLRLCAGGNLPTLSAPPPPPDT